MLANVQSKTPKLYLLEDGRIKFSHFDSFHFPSEKIKYIKIHIEIYKVRLIFT